MAEIWLGLLCVLLGGYVVLDGFDLGAGILHRVVGRNADERAEVFAAIGPFWAGNEVFLVAAGGTMLMAFPRLLGASFSGMYLASFALLWALLGRGLSIELRDHMGSPLWRSFFDTAFVASSASIAGLLGVALGNVVRGVPLREDGYFRVPLFTNFLPYGEVGLLDSYTLLTGALAVAALSLHGSLYLAWKSHGLVAERAARCARALSMLALPLWLSAAAYTAHLRPDMLDAACGSVRGGVFLLSWPLSAAALLVSTWRADLAPRRAFVASCAWLLLTAIGSAALAHPILLHSTSGAASLTLEAAAAPPSSLRTALFWWPLAALLAVGYFTVLFRLHRGKIKASERAH